MFFSKKWRHKLEDLEWDNTRLKKEIHTLKQNQQQALDTLKKQVARLSQGQIVSPEEIMEARSYQSIPIEALDNFMQENPSALLIDVRTDGEWNGGHINGAMHIELATLEQRLEMIPDKKQLMLMICARGARSAAACQNLSEHGYERLINVEGGMLAYSGQVVIPEVNPTETQGLPGDEHLLKRVAQFLDQKVRPELMRDGGDLSFMGINEQGQVQVRMNGACGGCGSKSYTVNEGITKALIAEIPEVKGVVEV